MTDTKQPIEVKLVTEIRDSAQRETIAIESSGMKYMKNDALFLTFDEEIEGAGKVKTIMKLNEQELYIMRSGAVSMRQTFQKGEETSGVYQSPYGAMQMKTNTERISYQFDERSKKGKLDIAYRLSMQGEEAGRHRLTLTFKEV
ncbi:DUF1934 domain-containing protein [Bacillus tianshenii]|nr:DUF1934 domain-containing protein [Bacillus tianshenii]